ncbi:MAG TPA: hypothetical protein VF092_13650 [Longimicrobium sp.]
MLNYPPHLGSTIVHHPLAVFVGRQDDHLPTESPVHCALEKEDVIPKALHRPVLHAKAVAPEESVAGFRATGRLSLGRMPQIPRAPPGIRAIEDSEQRRRSE